VADDVQQDDGEQDDQPEASYEKPEVEDLESDGPSETAAGASNGAVTPS
jgi:hypothetical protein